MRKFFFITGLMILSSFAHAENQPAKLFNCMDKTSFEINGECMQKTIGQNAQFQAMQQEIDNKINVGSENAMATMQFFPEQRLIKIMAHKQADQDKTLLASNSDF